MGAPAAGPGRNASENVSPDRARPADAGLELRFQLAIDAAGIGGFDWDLVTGRLDWDDRLQELFGYDTGGFDGTIEAFTARLHPDDRDRTMDACRRPSTRAAPTTPSSASSCPPGRPAGCRAAAGPSPVRAAPPSG